MMNQSKALFLTALIGLLLILSACGFHLRGHIPLPSELKIISLKSSSPYSDLSKQLQSRLSSLGATVKIDPEPAPYILEILSEGSQITTASISADLHVRDNSLIYSLTYQLLTENGTLVTGPDSLSTERHFTAQVNQALGATNAQSTLEREMRRDLITQLIYRLSSTKTITAIKNVSAEESESVSMKNLNTKKPLKIQPVE